MISPETENIIVKYLTNQANLRELDTLSLWLNNPDNIKLFNDYVRTNYAINYNMKKYNSAQTKENLLRVIKIEKSANRLTKIKMNLLKYAALILIFLSIGYGYMQGYFTSDDKLILPKESITLQLNDGNIKVINDDESVEIVEVSGRVIGVQSGKQLAYNNNVENDTLIYNTLAVPYGKRFEVQLSDGTTVNLNSGSSLKYPVNFIKGKNRQVFLNGEAFFNVAKDTKHPFIVNANEIDVRVLGTKFNISSYPEDNNINTVLVEGSVSTYKTGEAYEPESATLLKPGYKAAWNKTNKTIQVTETDVETHLAWISGKLILYEVEFSAILKKLERQYNVEFINNNTALKNRFFTAKFDIEDIEQVMKSLSYSGKFTYKFEENKIIINP